MINPAATTRQKATHREADGLVAATYDDMRALAAHHLRREQPGHMLQATAVVHEAYLRLARQTRVQWQGRTHFLNVASDVIRRVLVDHARARLARKRGGGWRRVDITDQERDSHDDASNVLAVDNALRRLAQDSPREAQVVEMRVFAGLTAEATAVTPGPSPSTVDRDWRMARAWLARELRRDAEDEA